MRVPVVLAGGAVVVSIAAGAWWLLRPAPPARTGPVAEVRPAPPAPRAETRPPVPEPVEAAPRRVPSRSPAPAAEPAPAPVEAPPTTATLRIEADVPDASVFLDRVGVGTAPVTIPNVAPGSHRLNVSAAGYDGYAETIEVEPGTRTISVNLKDVRLDVSMNVAHKHAIGSCKGVLSATPQALRYAAADGKDSFSVALGEIDTLDVDPVAGNLRVKTRQGRTYNFTDPEGNADRLFGFHRDVDRVRKRLAG